MANVYPRKVVIRDAALMKLLTEKGEVIEKGRAKSEEVEQLEAKMEEIEGEIKKMEASIEVKDLDDRANEITERMNNVLRDMEALKKEVYDRLRPHTADLAAQYEATKKEKEDKEEERNKIALKAQKYTDKIIPIARRLMAPYLQDYYEDYDTLKVENGEVVGLIFNHLEEFKARFANKQSRNDAV